jgi:transcriptional regulator with XRE-family HTH domain
MIHNREMSQNLNHRLSRHLKTLRHKRGWSLEDLAARSGISRASLSRIENGAVSPTAETLAGLCAAYGLTLSRLMMALEDAFPALIAVADQPEQNDPETGLTSRAVSPFASGLKAEVLECHLPPDTATEDPAGGGRERHLVMLDGALTVTAEDTTHHLTAGDCLRLINAATCRMQTGPARGARYLLVLV